MGAILVIPTRAKEQITGVAFYPVFMVGVLPI